MKMLMVGADDPYAIERLYRRYLRELGVQVEHFAASDRFYAYYGRSLGRKILFRLGVSPIYPRINAEFRRIVTEFKPDLIWVFKGMEIYPASLRWAHKRGCKLANYNPDSPFVFSGGGSGNQNVTRSIGLYDLHLTYDRGTQRELQQLHAKVPVGYLPFGHEVSDELYRSLEGDPEVLRACFVGNPDKQRAAFVAELAERGVPLDVYGHGWEKLASHPNLRVHGPVFEEEFMRVLRRYRVQINLMRPHNPNSHNMRTFEVPAVGGIALLPDTPEHRAFFTEGEEAFFYRTLQDCEQVARKVLAMPTSEAAQIRKQARGRSMSSGYSYAARAASALAFFRDRLVIA